MELLTCPTCRTARCRTRRQRCPNCATPFGTESLRQYKEAAICGAGWRRMVGYRTLWQSPDGLTGECNYRVAYFLEFGCHQRCQVADQVRVTFKALESA